ncbi:helix-turn-helix domain-containing protein [Bordetella sp. H567]|uniref:helix-turn-helix domain-containing protein n=1 Tax=Bordetella sp. H567 TaxID=1697043 RepID=UPI0009F5E991
MHANRLASLAGVDPSYITLLERGRRPPPREAVLRRLIAALLLTPNEEEQLTRAALNQLGLWQVKRVNGHTAALALAKSLLLNDSRFTEQDYRVIDSVVQAILRERDGGSDVCGQVAKRESAARPNLTERTM